MSTRFRAFFVAVGILGAFLLGPSSGYCAATPTTPLDVDTVGPLGHPEVCAASDEEVANLGDQRISAMCVYMWRVAHGSAPVMAPGDGDISGLYGDGLMVDIESIDKSSVGIAGLPVLTNLEKTPEMSVFFGAFCAALFWGGIMAGRNL